MKIHLPSAQPVLSRGHVRIKQERHIRGHSLVMTASPLKGRKILPMWLKRIVGSGPMVLISCHQTVKTQLHDVGYDSLIANNVRAYPVAQIPLGSR